MNIFHTNPKLTAATRERLLPYSAGEHKLREFLKSNPTLDDVKRLYFIEVERGWQMRLVFQNSLLKRISDLERSEYVANTAREIKR